MQDLKPRQKFTANATCHEFLHFTDYLLYNEPFEYSEGNYDPDTGEVIVVPERKRKFMIGEDGNLIPIDDDIGVEEFSRSLKNSAMRAVDSFYGYGLCNEWTYFLTVTVDIKKHGHADKDILYLWQLFRQRMQWINSNVRILCVAERHKKNAKHIHFHALVSDIDLGRYMTPALHPKTGDFLYSASGAQKYNLVLWEYGWSTCVHIAPGQVSQTKTVNYLCKYMTKDGNLGYNKKAYYHTMNLPYKKREVFMCRVDRRANVFGTGHVLKKNDKYTLVRVFKDEQIRRNFERDFKRAKNFEQSTMFGLDGFPAPNPHAADVKR